MKFRGLLLLFYIFLTSLLASAQADTTIYYFDESLDACPKLKAVIVGKGVWEDGKFKFSAFYIKGNIPMFSGSFTDSALARKEGMFIYYNDKGIKESEGAFENNLETGYWLIWMGERLRDSILYKNGEKQEQTSFIYDNGELQQRIYTNSVNNSSETIVWYTREPVRTMKSRSTVKGNSAEEIKYYPNGQPQSVTIFEKNKTKSQKYYKEDGSEMTKAEYARSQKPKEIPPLAGIGNMPTYPGGSTGFFDFFRRTFKAPKSLSNTGQTVIVTFYLDKAGFAKDIKVEGSSDRDVELEVMAVFRKMNAWIMNGYPGFGPITYTINL